MAPVGSQPGVQGPPASAPPKPPKTYTLTKDANFNVIVKVTRNADSLREEESSFIGGMLQQNPEMMAWFGDLYFKYRDGPGHDEMAERAEVMLDPKIQAVRQAKQDGGQMPPEAQAQLAQLKQQLDQAHEVMQKAQSELKDRGEQHKTEQETKLKIAQLQHDEAIQLQQMRDATAIEVARIAAASRHLVTATEAREEAIALAQQQAHEADQAEMDRQHELDKAQMGHQNAIEMQQAQPPDQPQDGV